MEASADWAVKQILSGMTSKKGKSKATVAAAKQLFHVEHSPLLELKVLVLEQSVYFICSTWNIHPHHLLR
jgi:hypothetical protein